MPDSVAGRRRFFAAALLGSLLALVAVAWMLLAGHLDPLRDRGAFASFYDVQGHALLHGHLDVDPSVVSFEGFRIGGRTYIYFGPVPALLRLPVLALTHDLDGRLAVPSMLLAAIVLLAFAARLHWRIRRLVRPEVPVRRADLVAAFLVALSVGAGSVALYLTSSALVYYETELWGAALAVAAVDAVVAILARPSGRRIAWAGLLAALAANTRFSVGLGPILALGLVSLGAAAQLRGVRWLAWLGPLRPASGRTVALLAAAAAVALLSSVAVNEAKFHRPFGFPIDKQVDARIDANRKAVLAANGGSLFGAKYVPSQALQAIRPDAVGSVRAFPFVGLPHALPARIGDVRFDSREQSLSALTSMPLLCVLALVGIAAAARRPRLRPLLGVLAATLVSFVPVLTIADITTRYLADLLPFLLLAAVVGLQALLAPERRRGLLLGAVAALTAVGVVVNAGAGLEFQRLLDPATSEADRASFVRTQDDVDRALGRRPHGVRVGPRLPTRAPRRPGDLFVVGRCDGLYVAGQHDGWLAAERTARTGLHRLTVRFARPLPVAPATLLALGRGPQSVLITGRGAGGRLVVGVVTGGRTVAASAPLPAPVAATVVVSIDAVGRRHYAAVRVAGHAAVTAAVPDVRGAPVAVGHGVTARPSRAPVCRQVARRAGIL